MNPLRPDEAPPLLEGEALRLQADELLGSSKAFDEIYNSTRSFFMGNSVGPGVLLAEFSGQPNPLLCAVTHYVHNRLKRDTQLVHDQCIIIAAAIIEAADTKE